MMWVKLRLMFPLESVTFNELRIYPLFLTITQKFQNFSIVGFHGVTRERRLFTVGPMLVIFAHENILQ